MPEMTSHPPGSFCWIELGTSDAAGALGFYTSLFKWSVTEHEMGPSGTYYIFQKNGRDVAAMYEISGEMKGMPTFWLSYISVANADAAAEKAKSLGAKIMNGPFDAGENGRMAVLTDPQGATFAIWQANSHAGVQVRDDENTLSWNELQVRDAHAAKAFYPALFGWRMKESPDYTEWHLGEHAVGGMIASQSPPQVPSYWLPYFAVADCDGSTAQAQRAGGNVYVPPMDIPKVGRFSVVADPQGAVFALIKLDLA